MYAVSESYKTASKARVQHSHISGTVGNVPFSDINILAGSFTVSGQICSDSEIELGQAYIGELTCTFRNVSIPRREWAGLEIAPVFTLDLPGGTSEAVPMGVYTVSEAVWSQAGIQIRAYDNISKLDRNYSGGQLDGYPFDLLAFALDKCKLSGAQTREEIEALPNGGKYLYMYPESDIETWRDFVYWLAQTLCCFVVADRDGRIRLRTFTLASVDEIDAGHRWEGSFSDYETRYTGLSVVDIPGQCTRYYGMPTDDALVYNLGSNPFLQASGITESEAAVRRMAILTAMQNIRYVPFSSTSVGTPAYDLGDVIRFSGGIADGRLSCITKYSFTFHGGYKMEGAGKDPALASNKSKSDKDLGGLGRSVSAGSIAFYDDINVADVVVYPEGGMVKVLDIQYIALKGATPHLHVEIKRTTNLSGQLTAHYVIDGETITDYIPTEPVPGGKTGLTHLFYFWVCGDEPVAGRSVEVWLEATDTIIQVATGDAHGRIVAQGEMYPEDEIVRCYVLEVAREPIKTSYHPNEVLDYDGALFYFYDDQGRSFDVTTSCTLSPAAGTGVSEDWDGVVDVSYLYGGETYTAQMYLTVEPVTELDYIYVETEPAKNVYKLGQRLNLDGCVIKAFYTDGTERNVTAFCIFNPANNDRLMSEGYQTVSVSYTEGGKTVITDFQVEVQAAILEALQVTTPPAKTAYYVGEVFDYTGIVVDAVYTDSTTRTVTAQSAFHPAAGDAAASAGTQTVLVSYTENGIVVSTSFSVEVEEAPAVTLDSITVTTPPVKKAYYPGERTDYAGIVVTATYTDETTADVTADCLFSPANNALISATGALIVTVTYSEGQESASTTFELQVYEMGELNLRYVRYRTASNIIYIQGLNIENIVADNPSAVYIPDTYTDGNGVSWRVSLD